MEEVVGKVLSHGGSAGGRTATQEKILNAAFEGVVLSKEMVQGGFKTLGSHPITQKLTFLELSLPKQNAVDIDVLRAYPNIMYLDVSQNNISSLSVLAELPYLTQLKASKNRLTECLNFSSALCNKDNSWESGRHAVGSMLTLADLSHNNIPQLKDLSNHKFLETLLLSTNDISMIEGLTGLRFLQVLDLSFNSLTKIEGLGDLPLRELILKGNQITVIENVSELSKLTYIDVSDNQISSIAPLSECAALTYIDARNNNVQFVRQTEFLREIPWLSSLLLQGNPCYFKELYRLRVVYRLPNLRSLDAANVSAEEKIRAFNLYQSSEGDLALRAEVHEKYLPGGQEPFLDCSPFQFCSGAEQPGAGGAVGSGSEEPVVGEAADEEMYVDSYSLRMGYICSPPQEDEGAPVKYAEELAEVAALSAGATGEDGAVMFIDNQSRAKDEAGIPEMGPDEAAEVQQPGAAE